MNLDIIIITHNHGQYLQNCLSSIFSSFKIKVNLILIINNSKDKKSLKIAKKFSQVKTIINKKPKGLSANLNQGIRLSKRDFILILNPDTMVTRAAIEKLINFMKKNPKVGICGPKLIFPDGSLQYSARRFPNLKTFLIRRTPLRWFLKQSKDNLNHLGIDLNHSKTQPVDWLLGACLLLRRKMIDDIGLFDEKYYLYVEDIDYCFRAWRKGWQVWYVPEAVVIHHHLALSDKKPFSIYSWYHLKSMWRYFWKNILGYLN